MEIGLQMSVIHLLLNHTIIHEDHQTQAIDSKFIQNIGKRALAQLSFSF